MVHIRPTKNGRPKRTQVCHQDATVDLEQEKKHQPNKCTRFIMQSFGNVRKLGEQFYSLSGLDRLLAQLSYIVTAKACLPDTCAIEAKKAINRIVDGNGSGMNELKVCCGSGNDTMKLRLMHASAGAINELSSCITLFYVKWEVDNCIYIRILGIGQHLPCKINQKRSYSCLYWDERSGVKKPDPESFTLPN
jgi:hypothetical protein